MIRLHHSPQTRSARVLWLLHELGVEFELRSYPFDASLQSADYLRLSPLGRVPALEIDGQAIFESGAMMELLCETFPDAGLGRSPGHAERAEWLQFIHFAETVSIHAAALTQQHIMLREDWMRSPTIMKLEARRLAKCLAMLDAHLADRSYLLEGGFSAADIGVGQAVWMGRVFVPLNDFAALAPWMDRLSARPGFQASLPKPDDPLLYRQSHYPPWPEAKPE